MKPARLHIDAVELALVSAIVLLGLIMVTSASISIASRNGGDAFSFLERQLVLCLLGFALVTLLAALVCEAQEECHVRQCRRQIRSCWRIARGMSAIGT